MPPEAPELDESDPNAGISDLEWRRAAFIEKLVVVASYAPDRRGFIVVALRAYQYRLHIDVHRPDLEATAAESMAKLLPPEWHEAWLWGYRWQPDSDYVSTKPKPFGLETLRDLIQTVRQQTTSKLDFKPLPPEGNVHVHLALNALEQARIHVEAARLTQDRPL